MATAGFYIHFPLCRKKCLYCDFASYACKKDDISRLVPLIVREIGLLDSSPLPVDTVFIGGGTPSLLSPGQVSRLLSAVHGRFPVAEQAEVTMEVNPESVTPDSLKGWRAAGVNRISMGVQCLDDRILRYLGRLADRRRILKAAAMPAGAGFGNFSFDLMFGLPFQDSSSFLGDIRTMISFGPRHFSIYSLHVPRGSGLAKKMRRGHVRPGEDADLYDAGRGLLEREGFVQYEISNFAKKGFRCRHNLHYWDYGSWHCAGPAAVGSDGGSSRWKNHPELRTYGAYVSSGRLPRQKHEKIDAATRRNEYIMMNLRKTDGIDFGAYGRIFGKDFREENGAVISRLSAERLMSCANGRCFINRDAMFVSNSVIREFFK